MKTLGWVREGEKMGNWDRSVLGFDSAWTSIPRTVSTSSSTKKDIKGKGKSDSGEAEEEKEQNSGRVEEDEEILIPQAGDSSVLASGRSEVRREGSDEALLPGKNGLGVGGGGGIVEVRRRVEVDSDEERERKEREEREEEERELMG